MSHISDHEFIKNFSLLLAILIAATFLFYVLAQIMASFVAQDEQTLAAQERAVAERIKPVGKLKLASAAGKKVMDTLVPSANAADGKKTYDTACAVCHTAGIAGAPKFGDKAAWKDRVTQGKDTLYEHALKGFQGKVGFMPAKGGNAALSEADVKAAVDHMVSGAQ
ncbi:MAG: c-type cytochrome [Acidiferrobacterales bacterium]